MLVKNIIYKVKSNEVKAIIEQLKEKKDIYIVVLEGKGLQTWSSFLDEMIREFKLPMNEHKNANAYLDWMRDLDWLGKEEYALFIKDYNEFMKEDLKLKQGIMKEFEQCILPFWESEVERVVVGGKKKPFNLYLVE